MPFIRFVESQEDKNLTAAEAGKRHADYKAKFDTQQFQKHKDEDRRVRRKQAINWTSSAN